MFGIGFRELVVIAFVLIMLFGLPFWLRTGRRLAKTVRDRFRLE